MKRSLVMKFGGASVAYPESFAKVASIVAQKKNHYDRLVVVVSAMGNTTNELLTLAHKVHPCPPKRELDMLLSVGERVSISLLTMALNLLSVEALSFTGSQCGIITTEDHADAKIIAIHPHRLVKELDLGKVCVVAGFQGVSQDGQITTLGRGGSDTTAVALGVAIGAERVDFYKDVDGVYDLDPKANPGAVKQDNLSYCQALAIIQAGAKVLHSRAVHLASKNDLPLYVTSFLDGASKLGSCIGSGREKSVATSPRYEVS